MRRNPYWQHLYVVKADAEPALRNWALSLLIEDRVDRTSSYSQFLSLVKDKVGGRCEWVKFGEADSLVTSGERIITRQECPACFVFYEIIQVLLDSNDLLGLPAGSLPASADTNSRRRLGILGRFAASCLAQGHFAASWRGRRGR